MSAPLSGGMLNPRQLLRELTTQPGTVLGHRVDGQLQSLCWSSANLVPVEADDAEIAFFADRVRRWRRHCASILGPADQVSEL